MIFTNIDKFLEFWCMCDFRRNIDEIESNWENSQAGRPRLGRPASLPRNFVGQLRIYGPELKIKPFHGCHEHESQVETGRLEPSHFGNTCSDKLVNQDPNPLEKQCTTCDQHDRATES